VKSFAVTEYTPAWRPEILVISQLQSNTKYTWNAASRLVQSAIGNRQYFSIYDWCMVESRRL